jgi:hypothetical protein
MTEGDMPLLKPKTEEKPKLKAKKRIEFHTTTSSGGPFIRLDAKAGKTKFAGLTDDDLMTSKPVTVHLDFDRAATGWIDFNAGEDFVGTDFDSPPANAGKPNGAKWGFAVPVAMPYPIEVDGTPIESAPEHSIRVTAAAILGAFERLYGEWEEAVADSAEERVAIVRIAGWERVEAGRNAVFAPAFELLGLTKTLEDPEPELSSGDLPFDQ